MGPEYFADAVLNGRYVFGDLFIRHRVCGFVFRVVMIDGILNVCLGQLATDF